MSEAQVSLELLSGRPVVIGRDAHPGFNPADVNVVSDPSGYATCSFSLKRPESSFAVSPPDLSAWAPCLIDEGGKRLFEGRVMEAPIQPDEGLIQVQGRGWQYNLDDDPFEALWVHASLDGFVDSRSSLEADLTAWKASGFVETGDSAIVIGWAKGAQADAGQHVGVTIDLGPGNGAEYVDIEPEVVGPSTAFTFVVRGHNVEDPNPAAGLFDDPIVLDHSTMGSTARAGAFNDSYRWITILMFRDDGSSGLTTGDNLVRIKSVRLYADGAYESGGQSVLKASTVVSDALEHAAELSADRSGISTTSLDLPHFATTAAATPREVVQAANAFHAYRFKVGKDRRPVFGPYPTVPKWMVTPEAARRLTDASDISAEPIYNCVLVEANDEAGRPLRVRRYTAQLAEAIAAASSIEGAFSNPTFATDASGWVNEIGTTAGLTRDTVTFHTTPGSLKMTQRAAETTLSGIFEKGTPYVVRCFVEPGATALETGVALKFGYPAADPDDFGLAISTRPLGSFTEITVGWVPRATYTTGVKFRIQFQKSTQLSSISSSERTGWIDSISLVSPQPTLLDKRGYVRTFRLQVGFSITQAIAEAIGDAFLRLHMRAPFKAELPLGPGDVLTYPEGHEAHPRQLVCEEGELLHFPGISDPDLGRRGRDGVIAQVSYSPTSEEAQVQIDNQRDNLEALLARYALLTGQG